MEILPKDKVENVQQQTSSEYATLPTDHSTVASSIENKESEGDAINYVKHQACAPKRLKLTVPLLKTPSIDKATHKKTNFYDLPHELRDSVYRYALAGTKGRLWRTVKRTVYRNTEIEPYWDHQDSASFSGLLLCTKLIHSEVRPIMLQESRLDISQVVDTNSKLRANCVDLGLLRHVKLVSDVIIQTDFRILLKSLVKLETLTFVSHFCIEVDALYAGDLFEQVYQVANWGDYELIGYCPRWGCYSNCRDCRAMRDFLVHWHWSMRPFKLIGMCQILQNNDGVGAAVFNVNKMELDIYDNEEPPNHVGMREIFTLGTLA